jgi:hypothetical protein
VRGMSSGTRCCICEVALGSGPVRGRNSGWLPRVSSHLVCDVLGIPTRITRDLHGGMDMRHASRANTISSC